MISHMSHLLLGEIYPSIKSCVDTEEDDDEKKGDGEQEEIDALTDALVTLAITDSGKKLFMGRVSNEVWLA